MAEVNPTTPKARSPSPGHRPALHIAARFLAKWRNFTRDLFDSYHPERHYMRGPGPKWREKHPA